MVKEKQEAFWLKEMDCPASVNLSSLNMPQMKSTWSNDPNFGVSSLEFYSIVLDCSADITNRSLT